MSTPNHRHVVEQVARDFPELLRRNTREDAGEFTERAVLALAAVDPGWGHIRKSPGQTQHNGHAEDAVLYRPTMEAVDILSMAGARSLAADHADFGKPAKVDWSVVDSGGQAWMAPIPVGGGSGGEGGSVKQRLETIVRSIRLESTTLGSLADSLATVAAGLPAHGTAPPGGGADRSYPEVLSLVSECESAFQETQRAGGREVTPLGTQLTAHLAARYAVEGFTREQLIAEARSRAVA